MFNANENFELSVNIVENLINDFEDLNEVAAIIGNMVVIMCLSQDNNEELIENFIETIRKLYKLNVGIRDKWKEFEEK